MLDGDTEIVCDLSTYAPFSTKRAGIRGTRNAPSGIQRYLFCECTRILIRGFQGTAAGLANGPLCVHVLLYDFNERLLLDFSCWQDMWRHGVIGDNEGMGERFCENVLNERRRRLHGFLSANIVTGRVTASCAVVLGPILSSAEWIAFRSDCSLAGSCGPINETLNAVPSSGVGT